MNTVKECLNHLILSGYKSSCTAHFNGDKYTEEELKEIYQLAEFVKGSKIIIPCAGHEFAGTHHKLHIWSQG